MSTKIFQFENMEQIKEANRKNGHYWFSPGTMQFFNSIVESELLEGGFFITSEKFKKDSPKRYTIRQITNNKGQIKTAGKFQDFKTLQSARKGVEKLQLELLFDPRLEVSHF